MSKPKGTKNKSKGYALEHQENMISSGAAYELANSFRREAELYKKKFEQSEKQRDHYKALYEAVEKLVDKNGWGNEAEWLQYQSLKIQTP